MKMNTSHILIITDNLEAADMLAHGLMLRGLQVDLCSITSHEISAHLRQSNTPDRYMAMLVDTDKTDGVTLCRQLRTEFANPLLLMTYEKDERYHLRAYDAGVDECITKPIGNSLFLAKIEVWLRRMRIHRPQVHELTASDFRLDTLHRRLTIPGGKQVCLTALENRLLSLFLYYPGQTLENEIIISRVWNDLSTGDNILLKNLIYRLRRKIEPAPGDPQYIQTVYGGYVFWPEGTEQSRSILAAD